jgi:type II secretion system protein N
MADTTVNEENVVVEQPPKPKSTVVKIGLTVLFFALLFFFTLTKLPQARMTNLIQGYVQAALDPFGLYISDRGRDLSFWSGFRYQLTSPTLELADQTRIELDEITVAPNFLALLSGKAGAHMTMKQGTSFIDFDGAGRGDKVNATIQLEQVDIGRFGLLSFAGNIKGSGTISGTVHLDGTLSDPSSLAGEVKLKLKRIHLDEQTLMGFQLPAMNIADGTIEAVIEHGKVVMKNVQIGKAADDIQIAVTGDVSLNRSVNASTLNLRAVLGFSDKIKQSLTLIDSIMSAAKQADGRYAYKLTGTVGSPFPIPDVQAK